MEPAALRPESFSSYPPQARAFVIAHLALLRSLPMPLVPLLLRELIAYDWRFPAEQAELERQMKYLQSLTEAQRHNQLAGFTGLRLPPMLASLPWVTQPAAYSEQLTAELWATHQMDAFHKAASDYATGWQSAAPEPAPQIPRLTVAVIGKGVRATAYQPFRKLQPYGTLFTNVNPADGLAMLLGAAAARAGRAPAAYGHWYIDGGEIASSAAGLTTVFYAGVAPLRQALLRRMQSFIAGDRSATGTTAPEALRSLMTSLTPERLGVNRAGADARLDRFELSLLTEGSGTQIFATTFAQWAAREALRRAQPLTLVVRFAPRQRQQPMNEMLTGAARDEQPDLEGSLVDADMGAYYTWINQRRLAGAEQAAFLAWFEDHATAIVVGPGMPAGAVSDKPATIEQLLTWLA